MSRRKPTRKKNRRKTKQSRKQKAPQNKLARKKKLTKKRKPARKKRGIGGRNPFIEIATVEPKGFGPRSAGQSGDIQGLSGVEKAASESVEELVEEGQALEAEFLSGVENAPDADEAEVTTSEELQREILPEERERE